MTNLRLAASCDHPEPIPAPELDAFEIYHLVRLDPRVKAAEEARMDFRRSPLGNAAVRAEIENRLDGLDPETRDRYDAVQWNVFLTRKQVRDELTGSED